jgi:hypothetical protein
LKLGTQKVFWLTVGMLIVMEIALEIRATSRGWDTILFGRQEVADTSAAGDESNGAFGPTPDFPFRSRIASLERPPGTARIWIASSSHAEDRRLAADKLFPNVLETLFQEDGSPVQVLNASRAGTLISTNTEDLRSMAIDWRPDVVVLYQLSLEINDLAQRMLAPVAQREQLRPPEGEDGGSEQGLEKVRQLGEQSTAYQLLRGNVTARIARERIMRDRLTPAAESDFRQSLADFLDAVSALGARTVLCTFAASHDSGHLERGEIPASVSVGVFRYQQQLSLEGWIAEMERFNQIIREVARERNLTVVDLDSILGGRPQYYSDFVHFSAEGHRIAAEAIRDELEPWLTAGANGSSSSMEAVR